MGALAEAGSSVLLFLLVFGMSATVDIRNIRSALSNKNAIFTGLFLQFAVLPFLGFAVVKALEMNKAMGVSLLVVTSSPGGSYSNWWCSMFNADLALSVTMTAISTLCSVVMLPLNLVIYAKGSFETDVVEQLDWVSLFIALVVVISAIGLGLLASAKIHSHIFNLWANKIGNLAGVALVLFSVVVSSTGEGESNAEDTALWDRSWIFYLGVASPCFLGLVVSNLLTTTLQLKQPERVTVSVECCYQNVGIATSVALTMFKGEELAEAVAVPLYYGLVEAVILGFYCIIAWKIGWTKAPKDESFCVVVVSSYEVEQNILQDIDAIEVVLGTHKDGLPNDLIFEFDFVEDDPNEKISKEKEDKDRSSLHYISYFTPSRKVKDPRGVHSDNSCDEEKCDISPKSLVEKYDTDGAINAVQNSSTEKTTDVCGSLEIDISEPPIIQRDLDFTAPSTSFVSCYSAEEGENTALHDNNDMDNRLSILSPADTASISISMESHTTDTNSTESSSASFDNRKKKALSSVMTEPCSIVVADEAVDHKTSNVSRDLSEDRASPNRKSCIVKKSLACGEITTSGSIKSFVQTPPSSVDNHPVIVTSRSSAGEGTISPIYLSPSKEIISASSDDDSFHSSPTSDCIHQIDDDMCSKSSIEEDCSAISTISSAAKISDKSMDKSQTGNADRPTLTDCDS